MSSSFNLDPWYRARVLGRGGFGLVTLWKNKLNNEEIAIKCLRESELENILKPKHKERWCKEVEIMHKLKHSNIVSAKEVPKILESIPTTVPLLAMEYCKLGDLRQVLVKPDNCCGLKDSVVRNLLKDVANGLSYLHSCKIIHRDLKPDNIVLQEEGDGVVYKLIDLGYAKELDQGSLCESFVGTIQYLAPELFMGKPYTCSVDYWSFGQVAHEAITGHRPFLPGQTPAVWMNEIQNKKRKIISVFQTWKGDVVHSSLLSKVNHLPSCLRKDFEEWLQLALDWDGKSRGRENQTNEITLFTTLHKILEKQVVKVFSLPTCETLSYVSDKSMTVADLQIQIRGDTGLEADDQVLLLPDGKSVNPKSNLMSTLSTSQVADVSLFLFTSGQIKIRSKPVLTPVFVRELLEDPKKLLEYPILKRASSDAVFVLQSEVNLYKNIISALKAKVENLKEKTGAVKCLFEDVEDEWVQLDSFHQFFMVAHKNDLENYVQLRKSGGIQTSDLVQKWIKKAAEIDEKLTELKSQSNREEHRSVVQKIEACTHSLMQHSIFDENSRTGIDELLSEGYVLYDKVQKIPKDVRGHPLPNSDMVRVLLKCMETTAKLLKAAHLNDVFLKIFECEDEIANLISPISVRLKSTKMMKQIIESVQKDRQREIWGLITKKLVQADKPKLELNLTPPEEDKNGGKFSPFHIPRTVNHNLKSPLDENMLRLNSHTAATFPKSDNNNSGRMLKLNSKEIANFSQLEGVKDVQEALALDKSDWCLKTKSMTQACQQMVQEMNTMNWDFLQ